MTELVAMPLEDGGEIVVEMDHAQAGVVKAGRPGQIAGKAAQTLEAALESVIPAAQSILAKLPETWVGQSCELVHRNLSQQEWDRYIGAATPYVRQCAQYPSGPGADPDAPAAIYPPSP